MKNRQEQSKSEGFQSLLLYRHWNAFTEFKRSHLSWFREILL